MSLSKTFFPLLSTGSTRKAHANMTEKLLTGTLRIKPNKFLSSADNLCKQFVPRTGPTKCWALSGSKLFDTLIVFLKEFFGKLILKKSRRLRKVCKNYPACRVKMGNCLNAGLTLLMNFTHLSITWSM